MLRMIIMNIIHNFSSPKLSWHAMLKGIMKECTPPPSPLTSAYPNTPPSTRNNAVPTPTKPYPPKIMPRMPVHTTHSHSNKITPQPPPPTQNNPHSLKIMAQ